MNIKDINLNDRPREKMLLKGKDSLGDNELLAIIIESGTKKLSAIELANLILAKYPIEELINLTYEELIEFPGIKRAKASKILASFELAKRAVRVDLDKIQIINAKSVFEIVKEDIIYLKHERLFLLLVDSKCRLIKKIILADGDVAKVNLDYLKIIEMFLRYKAYGLFIVHNHPSGDVSPSEGDKRATLDLKRSLDSLGINLVDHIIVSSTKYFSFLENNLLLDYL